MSLKLHYAYQLRDYQENLVAQVFERWGSGKRRLVLQLATGAGKTIIFSAIASEFLRQGVSVLVLTHRLEWVWSKPVGGDKQVRALGDGEQGKNFGQTNNPSPLSLCTSAPLQTSTNHL